MITSSIRNKPQRTRFAAAAILLALAAPGAWAEEAKDGMSPSPDAHIQAISSAPLETLMPQYAENARLEWIGGPLDGAYNGADAIESAWARFIAGRGEMRADVEGYLVSENPKGRTVIATVLYRGEKTIPVRLITTYRDGMIAAEIWQIDPAISK